MIAFLRRRAPAIASLAVLLASPPAAQCTFFDGLNGPCCSTVTPALPTFPGFNLTGSGFCWDSCGLAATECVDLFVSFPLQVSCTQYQSQLSVQLCAGIPSMSGFPLVLDYTRTWTETAPTGIDYQVWRFAAKVDMSAGLVAGCPAPPCLGPQPTAFFYGYVDYALNCATNMFSQTLVLFHNCDAYIHDPAHSDKPGVFHPTQTFAIVAPDTAANPFFPAASPRPGGALTFEALRRAAPAGSTICQAEEPLAGGVLAPIISGCACPLSFASPQNTASVFSGMGSCVGVDGLVSRFDSINTMIFGFPWFHLLTTSIGSWVTPSEYPGPERVFVEEGVLAYHDSCATAPPLSSGNSVDFVYGGSSSGGWTAFPLPGGPSFANFLDVASNRFIPLPGPAAPPFTGSVLPTRHLIYVNFP